MKKLIFLCVLCWSAGCETRILGPEKAGVAISFDDHFIDDWYKLRPLLKRYDARVTFYLTCPVALTDDEMEKISALRNDGHEIGFHGTVHGNATAMLAAHGPEIYQATELQPGLEYLARMGGKPLTYAHPGGNHTQEADSVLLAQGFTILRDVAQAERKIWGIPLYHFEPRVISSIYYKFNQEQIVDALMIDEGTNVSIEEMRDALLKAKRTNTALMLFGHQPLYKKPVKGQYGFSVAFLEEILKEANRQNLRFYTMSELPEME